MANVKFKGALVHTNGELPEVGSKAPEFLLTDRDLKDHTLHGFHGKRKILSIVPSLDTGVCLMSAKKFNDAAKQHPEILILVISADLPFAQKRICHAENLQNVLTLSMMRSKDFATNYGILLIDGPLAGLASRSVLVIDEKDKILYHELVPEITQEPDYKKALQVLLH